MGFGLLCVGYMTLLLFRVIPIEPIGFYLITTALDKLEKQNAAFRPAKFAAGALFFESIFGAFLWIDRRCDLNFSFLSSPHIDTAEQTVYYAGMFVFYFLLFRGIKAICEQVGYVKGVRGARTLTAAACVFVLAELLTFVPALRPYLSLPLILFQLLFMLGVFFLLFSCYRMIVTDEMLEKEEEKYNAFLEKNKRAPKKPKGEAKNETKKGGEKFRARKGK